MNKNTKKRVINSRPLFYAFLALLLAISTARYIFSGSVKYIIFDAVILLCFGVGMVWSKNYKLLLAVIGVFAFGTGWYFFGYSTFVGTSYNGETVQVVGRISDDVKYSSYGGQATVVLKDVQINGKSESNISLTITYSDELNQEIGDIIEFEAEVENVKLFTLQDFNNSYYRDRTPYICTVSTDDISVTGNSVTLAESFRLKVKSLLLSCMSEENATTAYAVIFGDKNDLDSDVYSAYKSAGIVHLLTVSGLHITFLIGLISWVLKKCRVRGYINVLTCGIFAFLYAYLCGFTPAVLRAGVMAIVLLSTYVSGKHYDGLSSIGFAGIILLITSPLSALDIGFLMSFFCVLSIYIICPWLTKIFAKVFPQKVAASFALSVGLTLGIFPFLAQIYGQVNFLSFFVNLLIIPFFSMLYPLLVLSCLVCLALPFMSFILNLSGYGFSAVRLCAEFFGSTALQLSFEPLDIFVTATAYVGLFALSRFFMVNLKARIVCAALLFSLCAIFYGLSYIPTAVSEGVAYAYYYSQSVVVLTNSNKESVLVDLAGESFTKDLLNVLGIKKIATLFLLQDTSVDTDLASDLEVSQVIRADGGEGYDNEILCNLEESSAVNGFSFVYRGYNSRLLGLEISFDNIDVFILKDRTASAAALESLSSYDYDLILLGKHEQYSTYFSGKILSYYDSGGFSSYQKYGNVLIDKNLKRRCLD